MTSLHVGFLHPEVNEEHLRQYFECVGPLTSVKICRDWNTQKSRGYGYVNFELPADAEWAIENLYAWRLMGKPMKITWARSDEPQPKTGKELSKVPASGKNAEASKPVPKGGLRNTVNASRLRKQAARTDVQSAVPVKNRAQTASKSGGKARPAASRAPDAQRAKPPGAQKIVQASGVQEQAKKAEPEDAAEGWTLVVGKRQRKINRRLAEAVVEEKTSLDPSPLNITVSVASEGRTVTLQQAVPTTSNKEEKKTSKDVPHVDNSNKNAVASNIINKGKKSKMPAAGKAVKFCKSKNGNTGAPKVASVQDPSPVSMPDMFQSWLAPHLRLPPPDLQSYSGNYSDDGESWRPVEISRLSSKRQHDLADQRICSNFTKRKTCSIEGTLRRTERFQKWMAAKRLTPDLVQGLPVQFLRCPSQRLLDRIIRRYSEVLDAGSVYMTHLTDKDRLRLLYTLSVNIYPIVLQIFPRAEGWPFTKYLGSCGRLFVSTSTQALTSFNISDSDMAADLAYQLLQIIHHLSANDLNYFFYFTSIDGATFGKFSDGRLFIRDTSNMGIIDKQQEKSTNEMNNEETDVFSCLSSDCPPTLSSCANITEKQNVILLCKELLPYLVTGKFPDSTQEKIDKLLKDCPETVANDLEAQKFINELMELLRPWRTCDARFAYRYPECKYNSLIG